MEDKNYNLVKIDSKLAEKIYEDVFSKSFKKAGNALGDIIGLVTSITLPIAMLNNYTNFILQKNIKKYEKKLENIKEEDRIKVNPEIGVPILEKLTYTNNEEISDLFLELLKKASNKQEVSKVHPKFIKIIENLHEDEAIILEYFYKNKIDRIPFVDLNLSNKEGKYFVIIKYFSALKNLSTIKNKENLITYINNLFSLGIIENPDSGIYIADDNIYKNLQRDSYLKEIEKELLQQYSGKEHDKIDFKKGKIQLSGLGKTFLEAIFNNN